MTYRASIIALLIAVALGLTACGNTVQGMGRDIERMGEKIQTY